MRAVYWTVIFCAAFLTGCASADKSITSDPPGAAVTINDDLIGTTPATYNFDFNRRTRYNVTVSKDGYISGSTAVYSDTAQANEQELHFGLEKDPSWDDTYECPAARNSLTIQVPSAVRPASGVAASGGCRHFAPQRHRQNGRRLRIPRDGPHHPLV